MRILGAALAGALACNAPPQSPTVPARMKDHERHGAASRDAVAKGDLETAKVEAAALAALPILGPIDAAWKTKIDAMRGAANRVAVSTDLPGAAHALAALAKTCGDCHTMLGRPWPVVGEPGGQASGLQPYMVRHAWGAAQMWDGLAIPSDDAWKAGADVLAEAPLSPELLTPGKTPVPRVGELEGKVHDLARDAKSSARADVQVRIYGDVMATCAQCHCWLRGCDVPEASRGRPR